MKKLVFTSPLVIAFLLAQAAPALAAAIDQLSLDPGVSAAPQLTPSAPARADNAAAALAVEAGPDGELRVLTGRRAPQGLITLPDDQVHEDPPGIPEVLPAPHHQEGSAGGLGNIDPQDLIPADLRAAALEYYLANTGKIGNLRYVGIVDFAKHSSLARFFIADTVAKTVNVYHVAHGSGSDPDRDGYATIFSNKDSSLASSLGFYLTGDLYIGKHGRSMRLHGLSATNSNAFERAVVIHSAAYVVEDNVQPGRSWGCLAVSVSSLDAVIATLKGGALIYAGLSGAY